MTVYSAANGALAIAVAVIAAVAGSSGSHMLVYSGCNTNYMLGLRVCSALTWVLAKCCTEATVFLSSCSVLLPGVISNRSNMGLNPKWLNNAFCANVKRSNKE